LVAVAAADLALRPAAFQGPPIVINESSSLPRGVYVRAYGGDPARGDLVVTPPPATARTYLDTLGVKRDARLLKRLAATAGDGVCAREGSTLVAGRRVQVFAADRAARPLPRWRGCRTLRPGEAFLLGDTPQSFDSRYFGPVPTSRLEGIYREVITW
jgi:conjugative transfer signal peptidase TraF